MTLVRIHRNGAPMDWAHLYAGDEVFYLEQPHFVVCIYFDNRTDQWSLILAKNGEEQTVTVPYGHPGLFVPRSASY